ncbi:MAG: endonuclease/exonuclease/phosphatase family protein [Akkermansiaceae bacterium]|nr:endonuclease/exonuclease/phosphatase family protein [Akkermansiaceae bacterium]
MDKHWTCLLRVSAALVVIAAARSAAQDVILVGWNDFSAGYGLYQSSGSPKTSVGDLVGVTGNLYGGSGSRDTWGSTDGTYGPTVAVGHTSTNGATSIKVNNPNLYITVTNGTVGNLLLNSIQFDFASVAGSSPKNMQIYYDSGDLAVANGTLVLSMTSITNGLGAVSDYEDVTAPLSVLSDQILAPGQSAVFRFHVDTSTNNTQALGLDNIAIIGASSEFRILTYNIHGGKGPADEGDLTTNLTTFRNTLMQGEDVLCLQEVGAGNASNTTADWATVKSIFPDYPYTYQTVNKQTRYWWSSGVTSIAILSKYPFESTHSQLIQTDPQGDEWERHAQHVQIRVGGELVDIFNFHNTYNFFEDDYASEKEGLTKFKNYVLDRLGVASISNAKRLLMLGDFNVRQANVDPILAPPSRQSHVLDHIAGTPVFSGGGNYDTVTPDLSDHRAVWVSLDLRAPVPDAMTWASAPEEAGQTSITMTATTASDPNDVEYYFSNTTIAGTSHDSGWQSSPVFVDTGLSPATQYSYTVKARDKSANANETIVSATASTYTDDGDNLPNDWELSYFPDLSHTSGAASDDWDKDGTSDYDEWVAGTDPGDPASRFHAWLEKDASTGVIAVKWTASTGRSYRVFSSVMMNSDWTEVASGLSPAGAVGSFDIDTSGGGNRFYRVEVYQ